jgi:hypothetical protein
MHAQQAQDVPLNQMEVVDASPAIAAQQGTDMQEEATKEGVDTTGLENETWLYDVTLMLLDLPYDGMPSMTVTLDTPFGASGYQRTSTEAETDYKHAQPSNIQDVANQGEMSTAVVVAPTGSRGGAIIVHLNMTPPQESCGQADTKMTGATSGVA